MKYNVGPKGHLLCLFDGNLFEVWKLGLKIGMYYLRTRPAVDTIKFTIKGPSKWPLFFYISLAFHLLYNRINEKDHSHHRRGRIYRFSLV